jgi:hypothetical protein
VHGPNTAPTAQPPASGRDPLWVCARCCFARRFLALWARFSSTASQTSTRAEAKSSRTASLSVLITLSTSLRKPPHSEKVIPSREPGVIPAGQRTNPSFRECTFFSAARLFYGNVTFLPQDFEFVGAVSQRNPEAQEIGT